MGEKRMKEYRGDGYGKRKDEKHKEDIEE